MKRLFFLTAFFYAIVGRGQQNCVADFIPNSNKIQYNQAVLEELIGLSKYDAFFLGEGHTIDFEPEFKYNFIKHLNSKYGIKDVFMEIGFSAAYFFNRYLQTGDLALLKENRLPYLWGHYINFWQDLFDYNKALPDSLKISIHGIDFERSEIFKLLEKTKPENTLIPDFLQSLYTDIHKLSANKDLFFADKEFISELLKVKTTFFRYEKEFREIYKDNFEFVFDAISNKAPATSSVNQRNKIWFENIQRAISKKNIKKFIGFFGAAHTRYNNATSLTVSLNHCDFFNGNILNISTIYNHFISTGGPNEIIEYGLHEKEIFDKFHNKNCRATIVKSSNLPKTTFKTDSDYVLFAREIVDK